MILRGIPKLGASAGRASCGLRAAGQRAVLVDDLLATGGTAQATAQLVRQLEAEVSAALFLIELQGLGAVLRRELDLRLAEWTLQEHRPRRFHSVEVEQKAD